MTTLCRKSIVLSLSGLLAVTCASGSDPLRATLKGHLGEISSLSFSPDGTLLASASTDRESKGDVKLWDVLLSTEKRMLKGKSGPYSMAVAFSPSGKLLAIGEDDIARLWALPSGEVRVALKGHRTVVSALAFSPDSKMLAAAGRGSFGAFPIHGNVILWSLTNGSEIATLKHGRGFSLEFTPDGRTLAVASVDSEVVELWDVESKKVRTTLEGHKYGVGTIAFSRDGKLLASGSIERNYTPQKTTWEGELILWDMQTGRQKKKIEGVKSFVSSIAFAPDGRMLAVAGWQLLNEGSVTFWDVESGKALATLPAHSDWVRCLAFSPDGKTLATGSKDSTVKLWNVIEVMKMAP